ncbi:hypothetical protein CASFOL_008036 [Castilleja foliolosa]|uniref:Uncharacterized protein n=1 Tax=Castilleja foliolosa TaxID=1961234 RepID=A0ABD3DXU3_9LAMI
MAAARCCMRLPQLEATASPRLEKRRDGEGGWRSCDGVSFWGGGGGGRRGWGGVCVWWKQGRNGSILRRTRAAAGVVSAEGGYSDGSRRRSTWETDQCW